MASRVLVVGSGAIGLRTALELLRRNVAVSLRSARPPSHPGACSVGAGGLWMPYHCDDPRTNRWALETLDELYTEASSTADDPLVELVHTVMLQRDHNGPSVDDFISDDYSSGRGGTSPLPSWTTDSRLAFQHLTAEMLSWQNQVYKLRIPSESQLVQAGYLHAWLFRPPIVDAPRMLNRMLHQVENHEGTMSVDVDTGHEYSSVQEMVEDAVRLECDAVVNCTGLGATAICGDSSVIGGRGVLLHYDRNTCKRKDFVHDASGEIMVNDACILTEDPPWGTPEEPCYLIPRGNVLLVGGSYVEGDTAAEVRPHERKRLMENAKMLGIDSDESSHVSEWAGFRPYRPTVRCEVDLDFGQSEQVKVVHNYGHGGSGWTVYVGTAVEVATLLGHD